MDPVNPDTEHPLPEEDPLSEAREEPSRSGEDPSSEDLDLSLERRLRAGDVIAASIPRRWGFIIVGVLLLILGSRFGVVEASASSIAYVAAVAAAANVTVNTIARRQQRRWVVNGLVVFDLSLIAAATVFVGPGAIVVLFLLAVLPYTFDEERTKGDLFAVLSAIAYVVACALHGMLVSSEPFGFQDLPGQVYVGAALLLVVTVVLRRKPAALNRRIKVTRSALRKAEQGVLGVRAPGDRADELGFLERSLNRMFEELGATISANQREADEAAVLAAVISHAAQGVLGSTDSVAATAADLAKQMAAQRELAEGSRGESTEAAQEAESLRDRAERIELDARQLVEAATRGRDSVGRAGETLLAIREDVQGTAATVQELSRMSDRIGGFAQAISRIARQTHLLALNAAIEAAHSGGGREGFAAVADEVRVLAGEAARSAREVDELIGDVRARIEAVARAMASGEEKVRDVGEVATDARAALDRLHAGVSQITELLAATAEVSRSQAGRMASLAGKMEEVASISTKSAEGADQTAAAMAAQQNTIGDLNAISQQLADLAERVRASITKFSIEPVATNATGQERMPTASV